MSATSFRLYFGSAPARMTPATKEELDRVEEIVVDQEMDMVWEAKIAMHTCLDAQGVWQHRPEQVARPFDRVRIEVKVGEDWTPLIDGPVVQFTSHLSSQPGQSMVQVVVRDDSVFLHRQETYEVFPPAKDAELARKMFQQPTCPVSFDLDVETAPDDLAQRAVKRGTPMQFLRELARSRDFHAYVLPSPEALGLSIGCFKSKATKPGKLPPLKLIGKERNLGEFQISANFEGPQRTVSGTLSFKDGRVVSSESGQSDTDLLSKLPPVPEDLTALRMVRPEDQRGQDAATQAKAATKRNSPLYEGSGTVIGGCYAGVLRPYEVVSVEAGGTEQGGNYRLRKVRHTLTRHLYSQEFVVESTAKNEIAGQGGPSIPGGIF